MKRIYQTIKIKVEISNLMKLQNIIEIYDVGIINDFKESK
jgi:hypothetical protein